MTKTVVVLARRDPAEAMRVAAGITIMGHAVRLLALAPLPEDERLARNLALAGVAAESADAGGVAAAVADADHVLCL